MTATQLVSKSVFASDGSEIVSDEFDDSCFEVFVGVSIAEGVQGGVEIAEAVAQVPQPKRHQAAVHTADDHHQTEGRPAHCITSHNGRHHLQSFIESFLAIQ